jgi:hypothetical protein
MRFPKARLFFLPLAPLAMALPLATKQKKPAGKIPDPAAFAKIASYCVDTSELRSDQAYDARGFVQVESKPGRLLTKLPWKLLPDCGDSGPDAVLTLEFLRQRHVRLGDMSVPKQGTPSTADEQGEVDYQIVAVLRVSDADSKQLLYEVETNPLNSAPPVLSQESGQPPDPNANESQPVMRRDAMYGAFWKLIGDVSLIASQTKP